MNSEYHNLHMDLANSLVDIYVAAAIAHNTEGVDRTQNLTVFTQCSTVQETSLTNGAGHMVSKHPGLINL